MASEFPEMSAQGKASLGMRLSPANRIRLDEIDASIEHAYKKSIKIGPSLAVEMAAHPKEEGGVPAAEGSQKSNSPSAGHVHTTDGTPTVRSEETKQLIEKQIQQASISELRILMDQGMITPQQFDDEVDRRPKDNTFTFAKSATGVPIEYRNLTSSDAEKWIKNNVPRIQQSNLLTELKNFRDQGGNYTVSIGRDGRGYRLVKFKSREAAQSVTREIRRETGKQMNRLINPDYAHNEMMREYKLVREALPEGTATRQMLEKTDKAVSAVLTASGLTIEAANLLVNAIRGALLESPELKFRVATLIPDDLIRQSYVVGARSMGNTLRRYIHDKYHLPDRPKQTPVLVNTLDQIKPEHYREQDAQKVGVDMRDLNREKAREFILNNVPVEKQASALETIDRLPGTTFGVQIMDSGWVRISASAREPRSYDNRPRYGSYDATPKPATS